MKKPKRLSMKSRRQKLIESGEAFSKREILVCYAGVFIFCLICGICMELGIPYLLSCMILCVLQVPILYYNYKKSAYEKKRFNDANAYLSQMAQAFAGNGKILLSLKETRDTFPNGSMRHILAKAIHHIEGAYDVTLAQQEALEEIAQAYACERIRTLHDFLQKAESRGGSCREEFALLENMRQLWEKTALKYRNTVLMTRNLVTFEYLLFIFICIFMLHQFPEELRILHLPLVQGLNTFLIVCFFLVFCRLDKRLCSSMLTGRTQMTEAQANRKLKYIRTFQGKKEIIRHLPYALAALVIAGMWFLNFRRGGALILGIGMFLLLIFWGQWKYFMTMQSLKTEIKGVFPCWLFDLLLLMQRDNVTVSLFKSLEIAPAVLKEDLKGLRRELEVHPRSADAFLSFLAEFGIGEVEGVMRKLYALNIGTGAGQEVMKLMIDTNMGMLSEAETVRLRLKGDLFSVYYMLPTIPVMICMAGYGAALMFVIFKNIMTMI